jgi:hypothetical protein
LDVVAIRDGRAREDIIGLVIAGEPFVGRVIVGELELDGGTVVQLELKIGVGPRLARFIVRVHEADLRAVDADLHYRVGIATPEHFSARAAGVVTRAELGFLRCGHDDIEAHHAVHAERPGRCADSVRRAPAFGAAFAWGRRRHSVDVGIGY